MEKLKKVLSPGKDKDNETMYGCQETRSANLGNETAHDPSTRPVMNQDGASALSMKSGVLGLPDQKTEERALRSDGITGQTAPVQTQSTSSELGRKAALTSAGTAAGAGGAYAANRPDHNDKIEDPTHTDRSFPLRGGAVAPQSSDHTTTPTYVSEDAGPTSTSTSGSTIPGLNTGTEGGTSAVSGDAALANLGLGRHSAIDHSGHSHEFHGDPCETEPGEKTLPHIPGPHATLAANMLDPHIPGEFPTEDGMDPHSSHVGHGAPQLSEPTHDHNLNREAAVIGGVGVVGAAETGDLARNKQSMPSQLPSSSPTAASPLGSNPTYPAPLGSHGAMADRTIPATQPRDEHHYGRNAALAGGGATAAGLGAYAATRDREQQPLGSSAVNPNVPQSGVIHPIAQSSSPQHVPGNPLTGVPDAQPRTAGYQTTQQPPLAQDQEHHYGRNAALAGGAAAATGAAGYAALNSGHEDTGPASKTIGPHDSNLANIVDPRVRPEPEKMKDHTTSGPWQSDTLNKLDPKVESDPYKADVKEHGYATREPTLPVQLQQNQQQQVPVEQDKQHHYGRDAALVGGTGAAAYGASQVYDQHEQDALAQKEREKLLKEQVKHDSKEHAKEQEKLDKHHAKEQEKAEEKRQKELEKLQKEKEKENSKLAAARAEEAEAKHKEHNKLHKDPPEQREKKDGILHRIFHHKQYEREGAEGRGSSFEDSERPKGLEYKDADEERFAKQHDQLEGQRGAGLTGTAGGLGDDGIVTEPHTGLPMNVGKYGSGAGGTDGGEHIAGYGEHVSGYHAK